MPTQSKFYIVRGSERVFGPFDSEELAGAAMQKHWPAKKVPAALIERVGLRVAALGPDPKTGAFPKALLPG